MSASASASASTLISSLININDFSYIIIDIGYINMSAFIHTSANRYVDELSAQALVISGNYSVPELLEPIRECVKTYDTNEILRQIPETVSSYIVTDEDLGDFMASKLVVYFPDGLGQFFDLIQLINHLKRALSSEDTYEMSAISFAKAETGNIAIISLSN